MLPDIPIVEVRRDYTTDHGRLARACYLRVTAVFATRSGGDVERGMRIDTGAPFSIVPYSLWHDVDLSWQPLGTEFYTPAGVRDPDALAWLGVPCLFGLLQVRLRTSSTSGANRCAWSPSSRSARHVLIWSAPP